MPTLSIITINRNNATGLRKTMTSIENQTSKNFEYIVVDGASTDGSVDFLKTQNSEFETRNFKYFSEPDSGIYNAMNKGIAMAIGEYLLFINSGDELANNEVVEKFYQILLPETELASGILTLINDNGALDLYPPSELKLSFFINAGLTHPNTIIRKSLFEKYGLYNEANKIVSDWEFFLVAAGLNKCNYQHLDFSVARFYEDGISSQNKELVKREMQEVIKKLVPEPIQRDIIRLQAIENQITKPAFQVVMWSPIIQKLLTLIYKITKH